MRRREFAAGLIGLLLPAARARAQQSTQSMTGPMDATAHRPVRLPPKSGAQAQLDTVSVQKLESGLKCQCTCPQDVHSCRTTDFSCPVSPAMHRDVMSLVEGGYTAQEIIDAFVDVYGERVLMAPRAIGFNSVGYLMPYVAMGGAAVAVAVWIASRLRQQAASAAANAAATADIVSVGTNATPEELERLARALGDDRR